MKDNVIVGVTQRVDKIDSHNEWRDALDQKLIEWVVKIGFLPVPIPNTLIDAASLHNQPVLDSWLKRLNIDALLLSGGNDIGDVLQRDLTERHLLDWAKKNNKPVLGICRGMQMMGVYSGERLVKISDHVQTYHKLCFDEHNRENFSESVNSYHSQVLKNCPDSFKIAAKSESGSLEAMIHKSLPWEAWMWHPEREVEFSKNDQDRFRKLVNNGK
jgi:N5-(cytidine 5'-diphosphoramidyl)-L-glutamine hydrolase